MAKGQARVTQIDTFTTQAFDGATPYCYRFNGAAYSDLSASMQRLTGVGVAMWGADTNVMYWGNDTAAFSSIGFRLAVACDVGAITWEYSTGASGWTAFTPVFEGTNNFENDGMVVWSNPPAATAWTSHTHSAALPDAYWIRASIASWSAPSGEFISFLRNCTLQEPVHLEVKLPDGIVLDVNHVTRLADLASTNPTELILKLTQRASVDGYAANGMPNLQLLWYWASNRAKLFVEDLATTAAFDVEQDGYWSDYTGRLLPSFSHMLSPAKMPAASGYDLNMLLDSATVGVVL